MGFYDTDFVFRQCGYDWLPRYIDRALLFNVSYDVESGDIKLYILDAERRFVYKVAGRQITKQYAAGAVEVESSLLSEFLGCDFDFNHIVIDTVEEDTYYVNIDDASRPQYLRFLEALCAKYELSESAFLTRVNAISSTEIANLLECYRKRAISLVRIPLGGADAKIYARPFLYGNGLELSRSSMDFLCRVHGRDERALSPLLVHLWCGADLSSQRIVIATQHDELLYGPPGTRPS